MNYIKCEFTKLVSVSEIIEHDKNPNIHEENQIKRLADILKYQGIRKPLIVSNLSGKLITGHGTLAAIKLNGWDRVPVSLQDFESESQEMAHLIADNAIQQWSELDLQMVNLELPNIGPLDIDLLGIENFKVEPLEKPDRKWHIKCPACGHKIESNKSDA